MSIGLALADAANNCVKQRATAILTLRSGIQIEGSLEREKPSDLGTRHLKTECGGWITVLVEEIVAVEARP